MYFNFIIIYAANIFYLIFKTNEEIILIKFLNFVDYKYYFFIFNFGLIN